MTHVTLIQLKNANYKSLSRDHYRWIPGWVGSDDELQGGCHPRMLTANEVQFWVQTAIFFVSSHGRQEGWGSSGLPWWLRWWRICLQCGRHKLHPWTGKIPWRREWLLTHILDWRVSWTEDPGRLKSMGSQRPGHDWVTNTFIFTLVLHSAKSPRRPGFS